MDVRPHRGTEGLGRAFHAVRIRPDLPLADGAGPSGPDDQGELYRSADRPDIYGAEAGEREAALNCTPGPREHRRPPSVQQSGAALLLCLMNRPWIAGGFSAGGCPS